MISIDPTKNTERENYKLLIGSIIPRPIAFVTTKSEQGVINGAPFSFFNIVSSNPPMISLAVQRPQERLKDTARHIHHQQQFVVHIVDEGNVKQVNETAASLPVTESEIDRAQFTLTDSQCISVPGIKEAKVRMECSLVQTIPLMNGDEQTGDLFIGQVVQFHIDETIYNEGRIDPRELKAVSRLAGSNYAKIGDIFALERPQ
ncbi:flavin reductase family protein [Lysinibacillus xylanilyticus]|uniref:flavin reductase family protein n=1 Tax=Lysinibacillus xylanilyticus TaxID=582475 RepID=UPI00083CA2E2|nr:flavin reductase family protein [Lysinibacillus xylanilyticus]